MAAVEDKKILNNLKRKSNSGSPVNNKGGQRKNSTINDANDGKNGTGYMNYSIYKSAILECVVYQARTYMEAEVVGRSSQGKENGCITIILKK